MGLRFPAEKPSFRSPLCAMMSFACALVATEPCRKMRPGQFCLPPAQQRVATTPDNSNAAVGFRTKNLQVQIERATLRLIVSDLNGNILQEDAAGLAAPVSR